MYRTVSRSLGEVSLLEDSRTNSNFVEFSDRKINLNIVIDKKDNGNLEETSKIIFKQDLEVDSNDNLGA